MFAFGRCQLRDNCRQIAFALAALFVVAEFGVAGRRFLLLRVRKSPSPLTWAMLLLH
ncbi:MAG: hypothetical protein KGL35_31805 [Bradyrhizobium sp.]|nr:hypothetical protein [Bradyrhizobium sp.]